MMSKTARVTRRHWLQQSAAWSLASGAAMPMVAVEAAPDAAAPGEPGPSRLWPTIRGNLFGTRTIESGADSVIRLDAPRRAADAGVVPLAFWAQGTNSPARDIRKIHLVIDENPQPVAMVLDCSPGHEPVGMETRVRIESYSHVRAIAQSQDGRLWESVRYVKASGGCSAAPPSEGGATGLGRMNLRVPDVMKAGEPVVAQLVIQHPNDSGLAMDQVTRLFQPAHYVYSVTVSFGDQLVWSAEVNFSISESPNFRFRFTPQRSGVLSVRAIDTRGSRFESTFPIGLV